MIIASIAIEEVVGHATRKRIVTTKTMNIVILIIIAKETFRIICASDGSNLFVNIGTIYSSAISKEKFLYLIDVSLFRVIASCVEIVIYYYAITRSANGNNQIGTATARSSKL